MKLFVLGSKLSLLTYISCDPCLYQIVSVKIVLLLQLIKSKKGNILNSHLLLIIMFENFINNLRHPKMDSQKWGGGIIFFIFLQFSIYLWWWYKCFLEFCLWIFFFLHSYCLVWLFITLFCLHTHNQFCFVYCWSLKFVSLMYMFLLVLFYGFQSCKEFWGGFPAWQYTCS